MIPPRNTEDDAVIIELRGYPDGMTALSLLSNLMIKGYTERDASAAVRRAVDSGMVVVGNKMNLFCAGLRFGIHIPSEPRKREMTKEEAEKLINDFADCISEEERWETSGGLEKARAALLDALMKTGAVK